MAINPFLDLTNVTAPDANFPYGSGKNETAPGADDGTPLVKTLLDDQLGFNQALLVSTNQTPSQTADNVLSSQYLNSVIQLAMGGSFFQDDSTISDVFVINPISPRPGPVNYQDGMKVSFVCAIATTTFTPTININGVGTVVVSTVKIYDAGDLVELYFNLATNRFLGYFDSGVNAPAGSVLNYAAATAPSGWLVCDGAAVLRSSYVSLFSTIGIIYGAGDGATTFNLPDLRGRSTIGLGQGVGLTNRALADSGGEEDHILTEAELTTHTHYYRGGNNFVSLQATGLGTLYFEKFDVSNDGQVYTSSSPDDAGQGQAFNVMSPFLALNYIIKY